MIYAIIIKQLFLISKDQMPDLLYPQLSVNPQ